MGRSDGAREGPGGTTFRAVRGVSTGGVHEGEGAVRDIEQGSWTIPGPLNAGCRRSPGGRYELRLYVAGMTPSSLRAVANIKAICERS